MDALTQARTRAAEAMAAMEKAIADLDAAGPNADLKRLTSAFDSAEREHKVAKAQISALEGETSTAGSANLRIGREPLTYERGNGRSVFVDMATAKVGGNTDAAERLQRHQQEMRVEKRAHPNQAAGEGGEFIAPIWMQDEWIKLPRAGRAVADSLNRKPFPGSNQVNLPKIATGSTTATQSDGGAVSSTDITTTSVTGQAQTIAGQQDVSMQLVDLSNPGIDEVLFDDLGRDYNQKVDTLVISSTVTNAKGLLQLAGVNEITFTQATPTLPLLYPKVANGIQQIHTGIFRPPSVIAMHPRRWAFCLASLDTQNRPLITPYAGVNVAGKVEGVASEAQVGDMQGLPVIVDANLPTSEGAGTNQDPVLIYSRQDLYLFEDDTPRLRVLGEVLSGTLQVRFQAYGYVTLIAGRLPKAISVIKGTGLASPAF